GGLRRRTVARVRRCCRVARAMTGITVFVHLAFATGLVLAPGWLLARAIGVRGVAATLAWSLTVVFGCLAVTFAFQRSLTTTVVLVALAGLGAGGARALRRRKLDPPVPGRRWAAAAGGALGIGLWRVPGTVEGDGLVHL